jgi:hypothetical protein
MREHCNKKKVREREGRKRETLSKVKILHCTI